MTTGLRIGFTGTRYGLATEQNNALVCLLLQLAASEFRHGSCRGADTQAARLASLTNPLPHIIALPGPSSEWENPEAVADERLPAETHLARNRRIVDNSDVVIVCPMQAERQERGGTWYTYDYALRRTKKVYLIRPDGTIEESPK